MRVIVSGGTGFIGRHLTERLRGEGVHVRVLTRRPDHARIACPDCEILPWPEVSEPPDPRALDGAQAVIHLAGEPVAGLWTRAKKQRMFASRILGTRSLVTALRASSPRPRVLVCASAIGYYGDRGDEELDEEAGSTSAFLSELCVAWEAEAQAAEEQGIRVAIPRIGIVLGRGGGALASMERPFRLGLGGPLGKGRQWWSWILIDDLVSVLIAAMRGEIEGVHNAVAPAPRRQQEFAKVLGAHLGRPAFLKAPAPLLKALTGGFSFELLSSKRVRPKRLEAEGFVFQAATLEAALDRIYP